jgi:outer membrane protein assembly factor BamA
MKRWAVLAFAGLVVGGCQHIPADSYGVARLRIHGMETLDEAALRACLATSERETFGITLGTSTDLECGQPPFDGGRLRLRLWSWPWKEWPTLDLAVFERDIERVERWYRARGFYDARVLSTELDPPSASASDRVTTGREGEAACEREDEDEGCRVEISITVEEGEPVLVESIELDVEGALEGISREALERAIELDEGGRFDEALYDLGKETIVTELRSVGYACAAAEGHVDVDAEAHRARVRYDVRPGPKSIFGEVTIHVAGARADRIPERTVRAAADIEPGSTYAPSKITNAQRAVYALGAFSTVHVDAVPRRGADGACLGTVDVSMDVTPGREIRYGIGAGLHTGVPGYDLDQTDVRQWDTHLLLFFEHRNFLGGLRRLRIEDRPKVVFRAQFPYPRGAQGPAAGNELKLEFRQPAFIEARTTLTATSRWDLGPDPNQPSVFRHDLDQAITLSRPFFGGRLLISNAFRVNLYRLADQLNEGLSRIPSGTSNYHLMFFEQHIQLDLRDDARSPHRGALLSLGLEEAGVARAAIGFSDWTYFRITPEARGYIPLPLGMVLAARFGVGAMIITSADGSLDTVSRLLGPTRYRLRGGGPTGHRGFVSGTMGDRDEVIPNRDPQDDTFFTPTAGGLWRWEASVELRVPIGADFGMAFFADMGDLNRAARSTCGPGQGDPCFRFNYIHLALGLGFRYQTIVGPLRLDLGFLVPGAQVIGGPEPSRAPNEIRLGGARIPGAISVTIGEAF